MVTVQWSYIMLKAINTYVYFIIAWFQYHVVLWLFVTNTKAGNYNYYDYQIILRRLHVNKSSSFSQIYFYFNNLYIEIKITLYVHNFITNKYFNNFYICTMLVHEFTFDNICEWGEIFILFRKVIQDIHQTFTNLHQVLETRDKHKLNWKHE